MRPTCPSSALVQGPSRPEKGPSYKIGDTTSIKWNAARVSQAADRIEDLVRQAAPYLEQATLVAGEARLIPNLPQYVDRHLAWIVGEIDRSIGGGPIKGPGAIRRGVESIRQSIPRTAPKLATGAGEQPSMFDSDQFISDKKG